MQRRVFPDLVNYFNKTDETQAQVAKELGISTSYLCMIKWREREPNLDLAIRIAERCNVPLESLIRKAS
jgi:DNA-binding XRE family transcriptional regulator